MKHAPHCLCASCVCLLRQEGKQLSAAAGCDGQLDDLQTGDQLPVAQHGEQQPQLALAAASGGFPHEFRCACTSATVTLVWWYTPWAGLEQARCSAAAVSQQTFCGAVLVRHLKKLQAATVSLVHPQFTTSPLRRTHVTAAGTATGATSCISHARMGWCRLGALLRLQRQLPLRR